jgi:hypothetical protein
MSARLRHLGTSVYVDERGGASPHGQVLWGTEHEGELIGIAWDWGQVVPGVVAMSDPMALLSNVVLVDDIDGPLPESTRTLHFNRAIYRLDWQRAVLSLHRREPTVGLRNEPPRETSLSAAPSS